MTQCRWPEDYQKEQWKGEHVAVIGSGASSIQTVPGMQPYVSKMDVFVRTPVWFFVQPSEDGGERPQNYQCSSRSHRRRKGDTNCHADTDEEKKLYRADHGAMVNHAKSIENQTMKVGQEVRLWLFR